uniref:Si:dkey-40g16.5 n=1 Tax=Scleropages formosus TaxID=113540 RepID=A0A8C9VNU3_SCLFO
MDSKRTKTSLIPEGEQASLHCKRSPAEKNTSSIKLPALNIAGSFEAMLQDAKEEVDMLFSKYADVMSERAAADVSQVMELEDILKEARGLESHLREKKEHLKQSLAVISDKLQG